MDIKIYASLRSGAAQSTGMWLSQTASVEQLMLGYLTDADRYIIEIQHGRRTDRIENDAVAFALAADNMCASLPILGRYSRDAVANGAAMGGHIELLERYFTGDAGTILNIGVYTGNIAVMKFALSRGVTFEYGHMTLALSNPLRDSRNMILELGLASYQSHNCIFTIGAEYMQYMKAQSRYDLHTAAVAQPWALALICEPQRALVTAAVTGQLESLRLAYAWGARNYRDAFRVVTRLSIPIIAEIITYASEDLPGMTREEVLDVLIG